MYSVQLGIKDTTESNTIASYLDLLSIRSDGQLCTSIYDKCYNINFHITNLPFLGSNMPFPPAYDLTILTAFSTCPGFLLVWMFC